MHYRNCFYKEFEAINLVVNSREKVKVDNKKNPQNRKNEPIKKISENKEKGQRDMKAGE